MVKTDSVELKRQMLRWDGADLFSSSDRSWQILVPLDRRDDIKKLREGA